MLTCKVGETIINCFDGKYDKHILKQWDSEKRLICPDCGKLYEYCHGEVISPYFRHKEKSKECDEIFSESETEEHIKGKQTLYRWLLQIQEQGLIQNVKLESYIPETRQRPDLYFEKDNKRFVLEYQCSPIATEFIERHRLYELANVNDVWILGTNNYNLFKYGSYAIHHPRLKTIEKNTDFYLDSDNEILYIKSELIENKLKYKQINLGEYVGNNISEYVLENNSIFINNIIMSKYQREDKNRYIENKEIIDAEIKREEAKEKRRNDIVRNAMNLLTNIGMDCRISYRDGFIPYYNWAIDFELIYKSYRFNYVFFIKDKSIDFCRMNYSRPKYNNLGTFEKNVILDKDISEFILNKMKNYNELIQTDSLCVVCNKPFHVTLGEMQFYDSKDFKYPKRCKCCRDNRKKRRQED